MTPNQELLALRQRGGFRQLSDYSLIEISGVEAAKFLQARLSNDVFALKVGQGQMSALLDRKAHIIAYFSLHRLAENQFLMLIESSQTATILHDLETYHFQEKVAYTAIECKFWSIQGGTAPLLVPNLPELGILKLEPNGDLLIRRSLTGDSGYILAFLTDADSEIARYEDQAKALDMVPLGDAAMQIARIEAGLPQWAIDFDSENLLPETGLENVAASYAKGCYQGQEVLARIRTYGAPRRGLVGLAFDGDQSLSWPLNTAIKIGDEEIGTLKSHSFSPTLKRTIALAYVQREYRVPDKTLSLNIDGKEHKATVVALPFYSSEDRRAQARAIYDKALFEFTAGSELKAIDQLREVLRLDPLFSDAYEALGVALSRHDQLDEAIKFMKQLKRLEPESVMAHANLSVFYMQKGDKDAAEEEKAQAMSIRMAQAAKDYTAQQTQEANLKKRKEEAAQRMDMFRQVLGIDPDDFLANAGMGSAYVDLERFDEAIPFLQKALTARKNHTVAYVSLAQAFEKLKQFDKAIETYQQGIAVAAQKGDITPMKDMQAQLQRLNSSVNQVGY